MTELYHIFGCVFATYSLETSINKSAPFAVGFLGIILDFITRCYYIRNFPPYAQSQE